MRRAALVCYGISSERSTLVAADAVNRSPGEGATPPRMRVSPHTAARSTRALGVRRATIL